MLAKILGFELKYQLRNRLFLLAFPLLLSLVIFSYYGRATNITQSDLIIGLNAPLVMAKQLQFYQLILYVVVLFLLGNSMLRDKETGMREIVLATPVSVSALLPGRFLAVFLLSVLAALSLGVVTETVLQVFAGGNKAVHPVDLASYAYTYAVFLIPNLLIFSLLACVAINLTRTIFAGFALFILFALSQYGLSRIETSFFPDLCALADPSGVCALEKVSQSWTAADYKKFKFPESTLFVWNRVLWLSFGLLLFIMTLTGYKRQIIETLSRKLAKQKAVSSIASSIQLPQIKPGGASFLSRLLVRTKFELGLLLNSFTFPALIILLAAGMALALWVAMSDPMQAFYPVSMMMSPQITQGAVLAGGLVILFLAGEMVWREKRNDVSEIVYATPVSNFVIYSGKLTALLVYLMIYLGAAILFGAFYQMWANVWDIRGDIYLITGMMEIVLALFLHAVLAIFIHVVSPSRLLAHIITYGLLVVQLIIFVNYGIESHLVLFGSIPPILVSDMNGFGHYMSGALWLGAYWSSFALLLAALSLLLWSRGHNSSLKSRVKAASPALKRGVALVSCLALLLTGAFGAYAYWNMHIRHVYYTERNMEAGLAQYERELSRFIGKPQPKIIDMTLKADLDPKRRILITEGTIKLENKSDEDIPEVVVSFENNVKLKHNALEGAKLTWKSPGSHEYVFKSEPAIKPGETRELKIKTVLSNEGFQHRLLYTATPINENGTSLFNSHFLPSIGMDSKHVLTDAGKRLTHKLPDFAELEKKGLWSNRRSYYSPDAQRLTLDLTISTAGDQIAVAPGALKKSWKENGKAYFHYVTERPIDNLWSVHSARYDVLKGKWKEVDLTYYHHKGHNSTAGSIISTMQASLKYFAEHFGPYQYKHLRVSEFPYLSMGIAFPGTISYPESFLINDLYSPDGGVFNYVVSHEVAHQWWGLQISPADHPGAPLLSESLAEYSALITLEKERGLTFALHMLKYAHNNYLRKRGQDFKENPMSKVMGNQLHIAYDKGTLVMHALKRVVGQEVVNKALRKLLEIYGNKTDRYPTAADLITLFKAETGPEHHGLIDDLFNKITFWEFSLPSASVTPTKDGKWKVKVRLKASKIYSSAYGDLTSGEINNQVEFGFYGSESQVELLGAGTPMYFKKRKINQYETDLEFILASKPGYLLVNPHYSLIEIRRTDNGVTLN